MATTGTQRTPMVPVPMTRISKSMPVISLSQRSVAETIGMRSFPDSLPMNLATCSIPIFLRNRRI